MQAVELLSRRSHRRDVEDAEVEEEALELLKILPERRLTRSQPKPPKRSLKLPKRSQLKPRRGC